MFKTNELDINFFVELAKSHVGEIRNLEFQTISKYGEVAGKFEILDFTPVEPHFEYRYRSHKTDDTPTGAELGYYTIKLTETKFYNGKTIKFPVNAYVQERDNETGTDRITKALFINNTNLETGKRLKAYEFRIIDFRNYI